MGIHCRISEADDRHALADLFIELQAFHRLPAQSREEILSDIEKMPDSFEVWLAEDESGVILGLALVSVYPGPGIAAGLYLKELFVTSSARERGVGRALMQALAVSAQERGIRRIDWVTTYDNVKARSFYDRLGATANENKVFYRLGVDAISNLATEPS